MRHTCTERTDLDELIGSEREEDQHLMFHYGPLAAAMKCGEELILENSAALSSFMLAKLHLMSGNVFIDDTSELIRPCDGFSVTLR